MKIEIFTVKNNKLILNVSELELVKEFKPLFNKPLEETYKDLMFIWLSINPKSPYSDFTEAERIKASLKDSELIEVTDELKEACDLYYILCYSTPVLRMIKKMEKAMMSLESYFDTVNFTTIVDSGARKGTLLHDPKELVSIMKQGRFIIDEVKELQKRALEELKESSGVRGDNQIGYDEEEYL